MDREAFFEPVQPDRPPLLSTILMAWALLLVFILQGIAIWQLGFYAPYSSYAYIGVIIVVLGILAARGRYESPNAINYLLSFLIVLIPILGTLYGLYFSGAAIARSKSLRAIVLALLLTMTTATFFANAGMDLVRANWLESGNAKFDDAQALASTPTPDAESVRLSQKTQTADPNLEATDLPITPTATQAIVPDCTHWSEVTLDDRDKKLCVYGEYQEIFAKDEDTYVMTFSDQPGAFQIWSYPKPIEMYLPENGSTCIFVTGWVKSSGTRPIIVLRIYDIMEPCS